ncbi:MAG: T9SS type A sorting domain-containing protein [Vicingaceae bacterium]
MNKLVLSVLTLMFTGTLLAQNDINFEHGNVVGQKATLTNNQLHADVVDNAMYFSTHGVTFHTDLIGATPPFTPQWNPVHNYNDEPRIIRVGGTVLMPANGIRGFVNSPLSVDYTPSTPGCVVPASTPGSPDHITNTPLNDHGCFFLTSKLAPSTAGRPRSFYVLYENPNQQASGSMLDLDFNGSIYETIEVRAYAYPNTFLGKETYTGTSNGDRSTTAWKIDQQTTGGLAFDWLEFRIVSSMGAGLAFDDFSPFSAGSNPVGETCCDGTELIPNGDFNAGNPTLLADDTYNEVNNNGLHSVLPGQYVITDITGAQGISQTWDANIDPTCNYGNFIVVNGQTSSASSTSSMTTPFQFVNIPVTIGQKYSFCFSYLNLAQCSFETFEDGAIDAIDGNGNQLLANTSASTTGACGWRRKSYSFIANSSTMTIKIAMSHNGPGDGNDLAFDDFSLKEANTFTSSQYGFGFAPVGGAVYTSNNTYLVKMQAFNQPPAGVTVEWRIEEYDCANPSVTISSTGNMSNWDPFTTSFPGYNGGNPEGEFYGGHCYRFVRILSGLCYEDYEAPLTYMPVLITPSAPPGFQGNSSYQKPGGTFSIDGGKTWREVQMTDDSKVDLDIFPNPGNGGFTVESSKSLENASLVVYNSSGNQVLSMDQVHSLNNVKLDLSEQLPGIYMVRILYTDGSIGEEKYIKH